MEVCAKTLSMAISVAVNREHRERTVRSTSMSAIQTRAGMEPSVWMGLIDILASVCLVTPVSIVRPISTSVPPTLALMEVFVLTLLMGSSVNVHGDIMTRDVSVTSTSVPLILV
uniref:Uncharacterized protein n=1 Tax=Cacopsylla melanoneura TaxID=428564 RepID=A0A8D8WA41_9HEMI